MDDFYSHVVRTTDLALSLQDERERQATFQSLSDYLKKQIEILLPRVREGILQTGQNNQDEVTHEESDVDVNRNSTYLQLVWRLKERKYFLGTICLLAMEANAVFANSDSCAPKKNLIDSITYFLRQYTPESHPDATLMREQALYVPCMFSKLCRSYSEAMREDGRAMDAIVPLQAAVEMSRPEPETVAKMYGVGAKWIDTHLPYRVSPKDALHYFRAVHTADPVGRYMYSGVTMEAYKKYILVRLIADGLTTEYHDVPYIMQIYSSAILPYTNIAKGFASGDTLAVDTTIAAASSELETDGNMGLAKAVKASLVRRKIYCLKHVYVTLSLECIKLQVGLSSTEEVENEILSLVELGEMSAVIDHSSGMVTFDKENWDNHNETGMLKLVERCIQTTMELVKHLNDLSGQNQVQDSTPRGGGMMKY